MRFKLRQIEVFRAFMLAGSVSGAARLLHISQPAVSRLLKHTEISLGLQLFERRGGRLIPTEISLNLFEEVKNVYQALLRVNEFVEYARLKPDGAVRICCSPSLGLSVVPSLVKKFHEQYPRASISLQTTLLKDMPNEILSEHVDIALAVLPIDRQHLISEELFLGKFVCAVPKKHPLAKRSEICLKQLEKENSILYPRGLPFGSLLHTAFSKYQCDITPSIEVPRAELACSLVQKGLGIAIVDEFSVRDQTWSEIEVLPLKEKITFSVSLLRSKFSELSEMSQNFIDLVHKEKASF